MAENKTIFSVRFAAFRSGEITEWEVIKETEKQLTVIPVDGDKHAAIPHTVRKETMEVSCYRFAATKLEALEMKKQLFADQITKNTRYIAQLTEQTLKLSKAVEELTETIKEYVTISKGAAKDGK